MCDIVEDVSKTRDDRQLYPTEKSLPESAVTTLQVDAGRPDPAAIERAAGILRLGGLVAFPTETVYGLGGNALNPESIARIFATKGRPAYNPLIAHCASTEAARRIASDWPDEAEVLAASFWPGPLTLVVPKAGSIPDEMTAGLPTVAIRVPSHPVALALLRATDFPLAAPSANRFTELSPTRAEHVLKGLGGGVDLVLDAGPTALGIESTVVDLTGPTPVLLRPGTIGVDSLEAALGRRLAAAVPRAGDEPRPAPGMLDRHYSPRARLVLHPSGDPAGLARRAEEAAGAGARTGAILLSPIETPSIHFTRILPAEPPGYAAQIYAALHDLDDAGCDLVFVEGVPPGPAWAGVRDRLSRAAQP
jgi:L-threonylcarbamoyladenylate synthase